MLTLIVAMDQNQGIGLKNQMPWHISEEMNHFRSVTKNHTLIMGRKTFEGIGKPLPYRKTIILTTNKDYQYPHEDVRVVSNWKDEIQNWVEDKEEYFVCGGKSIYKLLAPYCDRLLISEIQDTFEVDTYFPEISWEDFECVDMKEYNQFLLKDYRRIKHEKGIDVD